MKRSFVAASVSVLCLGAIAFAQTDLSGELRPVKKTAGAIVVGGSGQHGIRANEVIYSNTGENDINQFYWGNSEINEPWGDDFQAIAGGELDGLRLYLVNGPNTTDPNDPNAATLDELDITIEFKRAFDSSLIGSVNLTADLNDPNDPNNFGGLDPRFGVVITWTWDANNPSGVVIDAADAYWQMTTNATTWLPGVPGGLNPLLNADPNGCSGAGSTYVPMEYPVGFSIDRFYIADSNAWWFGGCGAPGTYATANFWVEFQVAATEPFGQNVNRLPDLTPAGAARYWFDPPIPGFEDPNTTGAGNWRELNSEGGEIVPFTAGGLFRVAQDPNSWPGQTALGWVFRKASGADVRQTALVTPGLGITMSDYNKLECLYETTTLIEVENGDGDPVTDRYIRVSQGPYDPNAAYAPLLDRQGLPNDAGAGGPGYGYPPFTVKYSPVDETDVTTPTYEPLLVVFELQHDPNTEVVDQVWTRHDGTTLDDLDGDPNTLDGGRSGNMVIHRFSKGTFTLMSGCPGAPGDANCDGLVNFGDIDPFVLALTNPTQYAIDYPTCDLCTCDVNGDTLVNFGDIDPFVALLTGG